MNNKQVARELIFLALICVFVGCAAGLGAARFIAGEEYRNMARLIGAAGRLQPAVEDVLMQALKEAEAADFASGDAVLSAYQYKPVTFRNRSLLPMAGWGILATLALGTAAAVPAVRSAKKRRLRIGRLSDFLEEANQGRYPLLTRSEDEFSRLEDELYKTVTELRQSRESALLERQTLADNLADISHQLKTPITSMSLMAQLLADSCSGEEAVYLDKLQQQLTRLESLLDSLLTLSRLDAGALAFKCEPVNVYDMLARAAEPIGMILKRSRQQLVLPAESELCFIGDMEWSAEAFLNLLKNCCQHTPEDGTISINCSHNPLYTEICVEDSGPGFNIAELPHIFKRFYKGKTAFKDNVGIGLALSKSIIEKQGGTIRAENNPAGGARFVVKFYCHRNVTWPCYPEGA
jgi:signal transduction histidine kinase